MDVDSSTALPKANTATRVALFLVSANLILWEVLLTRIYSTILFYHFAFMAVSVSMFGLTLGAVLVFLKPPSKENLESRLGWLALATALATSLAIIAQLFMPLIPDETGVPASYMIVTYILSALPFVPGGAFICVALTRFDGVGVLYAADLAGAAAGCVLMPLIIVALNGPGAVLAAGALSCLAAALVWRKNTIQLAGVALGLAVALIIAAQVNVSTHWLRVRYQHAGAAPQAPYEAWNAFSRIVVIPNPGDQAFGWGIDPEILAKLPPVKQRWLSIDSGAGTPLTHFTGDLKELNHLRYDVTGVAHRLRSDADVCVIGPGGGRDLLTALAYKQHSVLGIEVNPNIVNAVNVIFGEYTGHLDQRKDVGFIVDDGRSALQRTDKRFDIIQASFVDTVAATAAGAYAFTENGLYTVEAWEMFMQRLKPRGMLSFSRFYYGATTWPVEIYRLVALASETLRQRGVKDPSQHIILIRNRLGNSPTDKIATLLVSPDPFSAEDVARSRETCKELLGEIALGPGISLDPNFAFLQSSSAAEQRARYPLDVTATFDDRPYFFFHSRLSDVLSGKQVEGFGGSAFNLPAVRMLVTLTLTVLALGAALILIPAFLMRGKSGAGARTGPLAIPIYFAAIGVAFMFVEIGLIQRLSLFLGHPIYGFTVVLFGLLLSGGLGALISDRLLGSMSPERQWRILALAALIIFVVELLSSIILKTYIGESTPLRIVLTLALICPTASFMGFGFPMGMALARVHKDSRTAWFWAINGATSVIGSVLAMLCSIELGIRAAIFTGLAIYILAAVLHGVAAARKPAAD
jgi:hypothetical protein